ncbi:MAG: glycosyltransferase [Salinivirgaceae bacterium]|nr:glycosyltransferase [Salinivirgaceae bacterium]
MAMQQSENQQDAMHILVLCNKMPYPSNDGGTIATLNMIMGLAAQGNKVDVLAMQTPKHNFPLTKLTPELKHNIKWNSVWIDTDVRVISMLGNLLFSKLPYNAERFVSDEFDARLKELLSNDYDIVQLEGLYLSSYIPTIRKYSKSTISLRAHNVERQIWERLAATETNLAKKIYKRILSRRIGRLESLTLKQIDLLVPITKNDAEKLPFNSQNTYVAPTGIEPQKFAPYKEPAVGKSLFYIGALDWEPNQEAVLWFVRNVWTDIQCMHPDWEFHIAGRNAPRSFANELAKYPVVFDGQVASAQEFIERHNIMVVPLLSGSGMRIKIIEAMAHSRCVVTTPVGAEGIDAENGRQILIGTTPDELKQLVDKAIGDAEYARNVAEEAYSFTNANFNNRMIIRGLNQFYKQWLQR